MKLNRILALLVALTMIFAFVACDSAANTTTPENKTPAENPKDDPKDPSENPDPNNPIDNLNDNGGYKEGYVLKTTYESMDAGLSQASKFQFNLKGFKVENGETISVVILPLERTVMSKTKLRLPESPYTEQATEIKLITKGKWAGWYEISCTAPQKLDSIMVCLRHDTEFTDEDDAAKEAVYIARVAIAGKEIPLSGVSAVKCVVSDMSSTFVEAAPAERLSANLAANPDAPEYELEETGSEKEYVVRDDWADDVKKAVNDFIAAYGKDSANYNPNSYVVSDFDNTCSIFDVEEQLAAHQLQVMAFEIKPEELAGILKTELGTLTDPREGYAKDGASHSYQDWIDDITAAYSALYTKYGPFTAAGLEADKQATIQADPQWLEFAAKMRAMYDLVYDNESAAVAYPWVLYWFTNMTEEQVYTLAKASHNKYKAVETSEVTWTSPESISSKVGQVSYTWTSGTQVSKNINEMFAAYQANGIKVWICSASATDPIRAAVDAWDLHDKITGVLAMTNKLENGKYVNQYDYENGYAWFANADGTWTKGDVATEAQTQGAGKVTAVNNVLGKLYGCGPLAGFMDSTGDYDFCTVYDSLKLVICFNRASRKVTDGGGVIGEMAIYERDTLGYDLAKANAAGDTLYVLQGREENGLRTLRNSNKTMRYGKTEEKLFRDENNEAQLQYMIDNKMTVKEALDTFAIKTAADAADNKLGFKYGFTTKDTYLGYHEVKADNPAFTK